MSEISWSVIHITGKVTPIIGASIDFIASLKEKIRLRNEKTGIGFIKYRMNTPQTNKTK